MSREIELRGRHLLAIAVAAVLLAAGVYFAFFAGRGATGSGAGTGAAAGQGGATAGTEGSEPEMLDRTVFDDRGGNRSQLQVTPEQARGGAYEIDLGAFATRTDAEKVRAAAANGGIPTGVAASPDGSYRVVAGPFATSPEAEGAAERLRSALGRPVEVVPQR